jgi:hypothetical protein
MSKLGPRKKKGASSWFDRLSEGLSNFWQSIKRFFSSTETTFTSKASEKEDEDVTLPSAEDVASAPPTTTGSFRPSEISIERVMRGELRDAASIDETMLTKIFEIAEGQISQANAFFETVPAEGRSEELDALEAELQATVDSYRGFFFQNDLAIPYTWKTALDFTKAFHDMRNEAIDLVNAKQKAAELQIQGAPPPILTSQPTQPVTLDDILAGKLELRSVSMGEYEQIQKIAMKQLEEAEAFFEQNSMIISEKVHSSLETLAHNFKGKLFPIYNRNKPANVRVFVEFVKELHQIKQEAEQIVASKASSDSSPTPKAGI